MTMLAPPTLLYAYLPLLAAERLAELSLSRRNTRRARAAGAVEAGRGHLAPMVLFHAAFLVGCAVEPLVAPRRWPLAASLAFLSVALLAQGLRWWAVATLGERWAIRILVWPGAAPVTGGPYRFLRHPNYLAVVAELAAVPLIGGAVYTALAAAALDLALLSVRIPQEERALGDAWAHAFAGRRRFLPGGRR